MTLPAFDTWNLRGVDGPAYKVGPTCSRPGCQRIAEHAHHIVRRSQLGGDYKWIEVDGQLIANLTGLCPQHHEVITGRVGGHTAAIRYDKSLFYWCMVETGPSGLIHFVPLGALDPQPPTPDSLAQRASLEEPGSDHCPFCGQTTRRRRSVGPLHERRRRKSWCIKVPDDHEDGADVLDTLVDDLAPLLGVEPSQTGRYFVIAPVLVFAQQKKHEFLEAIKGIGG